MKKKLFVPGDLLRYMLDKTSEHIVLVISAASDADNVYIIMHLNEAGSTKVRAYETGFYPPSWEKLAPKRGR